MSAKAALAGLGKNAVQLGHGKALHGIVLVHVDRQAVQGHVVAGWLEALLGLEGVYFFGLHLPRHGAQERLALGQRRRGRSRALALDLARHVGIHLLEIFGPIGHHVQQRVGADAGQSSGQIAGLFVIRRAGGLGRRTEPSSAGRSTPRPTGRAGRTGNTSLHSLLVVDRTVSPAPATPILSAVAGLGHSIAGPYPREQQ